MKSVELGINNWRLRKFRYRLVVSKELMENNPWVDLQHADSPKEIIEKVHGHLQQGEIDVEQAIKDSIFENRRENE
jgi:hypothetical protein